MGKKNEIKEIEVPMFEQDGILYETIIEPAKGTIQEQPLFVTLNGNGEPIYEPNIEWDGQDTKYLPCNNQATKNKAVILPQGVTKYENEDELIKEIQEFIHTYLDISPDYEVFATYYVLLTWVYDRLDTVPYLRVMGNFGNGKSRFLKTIGWLCYKPIKVSGAATPAPIFRLMGFWKGTLLIEEGDRKESDAAEEVTKILNCGFERNNPVIRCDKENPKDIEIHEVYGPKVIATRYPFYDLALESRCLTENIKETTRKDIPSILPQNFYDRQEILRQKLLYFRLKERGNIDTNLIQNINLGNVEKRLKQALSSFAVLFANKPALMEKFKVFVVQYQKQLISERETSLDGLIVNYLLQKQELEAKENVTPKDIQEYLRDEHNMQKITTSSVGKQLKGLGILTNPKKIEGKTKRVICWNQDLMNNLFEKYNSVFWEFNNQGLQQSVTPVTDVTLVTGVTGSQNNEFSVELLQSTAVTGVTGQGYRGVGRDNNNSQKNNESEYPYTTVTPVTPVTANKLKIRCSTCNDELENGKFNTKNGKFFCEGCTLDFEINKIGGGQ